MAKTSLTALQRQHALELQRVRHEADAAHAARESSWAAALEQAHAAAAVAAAAGHAQEAAGPLLERVAALETGACVCCCSPIVACFSESSIFTGLIIPGHLLSP